MQYILSVNDSGSLVVMETFDNLPKAVLAAVESLLRGETVTITPEDEEDL